MLAGAAVALGALAHAGPSSALDFTCIETSKYKYVAKLFNDDPRQFASYFNMGSSYQPPADACRAGLVSGGVEKDDGERALQFILANRGWLATLYLGSRGGNIAGGLRVAVVARMFWLKTITAPAKAFRYLPDFMIPPAGSGTDASGNWQAFVAATGGADAATTDYARCTSACTFILAGGIDRKGLANVHRPHTSKDSSLAYVAQRLEHAEASMVALYRHMDAGQAIEDTARSTATQATTPKVMPRFSRFIEDSLLKKCKSDAAQLDDARRLLDWGIAGDIGLPAGLVDLSALQAARATVDARSRTVEQCVAGFQEHERVAKYVKLCPNDRCTADSLKPQVDDEIRKMLKP